MRPTKSPSTRSRLAQPPPRPRRTLTYTANGLVQTLKDAENNLTTYLYDGHDRLSKTQFPTATPKGAATSDTANYEQLTYEIRKATRAPRYGGVIPQSCQ